MYNKLFKTIKNKVAFCLSIIILCAAVINTIAAEDVPLISNMRSPNNTKDIFGYGNGIADDNEEFGFKDGNNVMVDNVPFFWARGVDTSGVNEQAKLYLFPEYNIDGYETVPDNRRGTKTVRLVLTVQENFTITAGSYFYYGTELLTLTPETIKQIAKNGVDVKHNKYKFDAPFKFDMGGAYADKYLKSTLVGKIDPLIVELFLGSTNLSYKVALNESDTGMYEINNYEYGDIKLVDGVVETYTSGDKTIGPVTIGPIKFNLSSEEKYLDTEQKFDGSSVFGIAMQDYMTNNKNYDSNDYPALDNVYKLVKKHIEETLTKKLEAAVIGGGISGEEPSEGDKDEATEGLKGNGSALKAWMMVVNNFFNTGSPMVDDTHNSLGLTDDELKLYKPMSLFNYGHQWMKIAFDDGTYMPSSTPTVNEAVILGYKPVPLSTYNITGDIENYKLTPYEDYLLRSYFSILRQYRYISDKTVSDVIDAAIAGDSKLEDKFAISNAYSTTTDELGTPNYLFNDGADDLTSTEPDVKIATLKEDAGSSVAILNKTSENTKPDAKVVAQNFENISKYLSYGIMSADANYAKDAASTNTGDVGYCKYINDVIPSINVSGSSGNKDPNDPSSIIMKENVDYTAFGLPELVNINRIVNNEQGREHAAKLYLSIMYIKSYASIEKAQTATPDPSGGKSKYETTTKESLAGLTVDAAVNISDLKSSLISNKKIDAFLDAEKNKTEEEKKKTSLDLDIGSTIRAYIQIHDGMNYIGLSPDDKWVSPELKRIYEYYDAILPYKDASMESTYDATALAEVQPFAEFFNLDTNVFGDNVKKGIAASATYIPLVTNSFDYSAISIVNDPDFITDFHYKYGFHRKALFIDSSQDAAVNAYVTGKKDSLKVATLNDMLMPEKDIVLYQDPNFYNIRPLAEKQDLSYSKLQNTEDADKQSKGLIQGVADSWAEWNNLDASSICKTAGTTLYSDALGTSAISAYGTDKDKQNFWDVKSKDHYILSTDAIETYYTQSEYSEVQSFAFVSGIYRHKPLLTICQGESANPKPVFVSSATLPKIIGITKKEFNSIYNYLMVKNLKANLGLDYKTELDLDSPLFIDVYGNISTQSGLIVIPAASNSTLYEPDEYSVLTTGFVSLINNQDSYRLPLGFTNSEMLDDSFMEDVQNECYSLQNKQTETSSFQLTNISTSSKVIKQAFYQDALANCDVGLVGSNTFKSRVNMMMETMRGAPIENIDFDEEGLNGMRNLDKTGIYIAYRIEQLGDLLLSSSEGNSLLKMPNLAFMEGVEYVVVIVFKVLLSAGVFLLWFKLYADGASGNLGIRTGVEFIVSMASIVIGIVLLPTLMNFSYYQTNKQLLQKEAAYLMMLNTEKTAEGKEVGVREIREPSSTTEFYIKLNEVKVPWWTVITDVYNSDMFATMEDVYDKAFEESIYSTFDGAQKRGNGIYVNVKDLFASSEIRFGKYVDDKRFESIDDAEAGFLYQAVGKNNKMSYTVPYYAIIDKVLNDAALYNKAYSTMAYRTKIMQNGNVRTVGLLESYFKSNSFLSDSEANLFGLYDIYGIPYSTDLREPVFTQEQIDIMKSSLWYNGNSFTMEQIEEKLKLLDQKGKEFIVENRTLLNKVSDETFLKCFALYMSVEHNNLFKIPAARGIELMEIDTKDIIRLSLAPKSDVMHSISMSFGRFTFTQAGTFGTILMAFLLLVYYFTSLIKPAIMIALVGALIFSYVYKKLMRHEQNHSLEGYITSAALICMVNVIYALVLKLSVMLPNFGVDPIFSILAQIMLQAIYFILLYLIGYTVLKNVNDIGFFTYKTFYDAHMSNRINTITMHTNKLMANSILAPFSHTANNMRNNYINNKRTAGLTGEDILQNMNDRDEQRQSDAYNSRNNIR